MSGGGDKKGGQFHPSRPAHEMSGPLFARSVCVRFIPDWKKMGGKKDEGIRSVVETMAALSQSDSRLACLSLAASRDPSLTL